MTRFTEGEIHRALLDAQLGSGKATADVRIVIENLAARVAELERITRQPERRPPAPQWCSICKQYHVGQGERTDAGVVTRPCPNLPADDRNNIVGQ